MHQHVREVCDIERTILEFRETDATQVNEADVIQAAKMFGGMAQHVDRDIGSRPGCAIFRERFADPARSTADLEDVIILSNVDQVQQVLNRFIRGAVDVLLIQRRGELVPHLRVVSTMEVNERRIKPAALCLRPISPSKRTEGQCHRGRKLIRRHHVLD